MLSLNYREMEHYHHQLGQYEMFHPTYEGESDEDTEDASESETPRFDYEHDFTEIKEQMYIDKLNNLRDQLVQLETGKHPEYVKRLQKIETMRQDRLLLNDAFQAYEIERVEREYINEKKAALREFEERKIELRENLILELEDRKKMIESERTSLELMSDSAESKPMTTRKLRRRPNEPAPVTERRRRTSPAQLNHQLDEKEIFEDLKALQKALNGKATTPSSSRKTKEKDKDKDKDKEKDRDPADKS